jgi:hypothetical protein
LGDADMAAQITGLGQAQPADRSRAARAIFERGSELARSVIEDWLACAPLADLLARGPSGKPELTVGVAVRSQTFERIREANGGPPLAEVPPDQDAREFEMEYPGGIRLDILTAGRLGSGGAIDRYLQKFGEGIQQVEVGVIDVDRATDALRGAFSIEPIYPAARPGANGTRVNFFLVAAADGRKILIELVEKQA